MMKVSQTILTLACACSVLGAVGAPITGSCPSAAQEIPMTGAEQSRKISLVSAYNEDTRLYDVSNQVFFLKATLSRSRAYSVWLTDKSGDTIDIYSIDPAEATDDEQIEPSAMFLEYSGKWGSMCVLTEDEWYVDPDDPEMSDPVSWTYYFQISGNKGDTVMFHWQQGNQLPKGIEENPELITPQQGKELSTKLKKFVTGEYAYQYQFEGLPGRRYLFATLNGTAANAYTLSFGGSGKATEYAKWLTTGNAAWSYDPDMEGPCNVIVSEPTENDTATQGLKYKLLPVRTLAAHNPKTLALGATGVTFVPGRINATDNAYYDEIIDQQLFSVALTKNASYVAETTGALSNLLMRVYNASGAILYESRTKGDGTGDVRCGFTAPLTGIYYIGVCENLPDDDLDELCGQPVCLTIEEVTPEVGVPDRWDPADDTTSRACALTPALGYNWSYPTAVDPEGHGWHALGKSDWYDVFAINARAGMTYRLVTSLNDESKRFTRLAARVFYMNGKKEVTVSASGDVNPDSTNPLNFKADNNGIYYVRLSVEDGVGLDFPEYKMHVSTCDTEKGSSDGYGLLKVMLDGTTDGAWAINKEKVFYPSDGAVPLKAGAYTVKFQAAKGFGTPATRTVTVLAGKTTTLSVAYGDTFDPKDDTIKGATSWALKTTPTYQSRTLWTDDKQDYFVFTAKEGQYYDFALADVTGDAVISIVDANDAVVGGISGQTVVSQATFPNGKFYVKVHHGTKEAKGGAYTLSGFYANVGAIKFGKTSVSAKDSAATVALTVNRTAKDGRVRVRYSTVAGTAKPGESYIAQNGVLEWANGDNKAKTITVKLLPPLLGIYDAKSAAKSFKVVLKPVAELEGDEYPAQITADTCTVTVTQSAPKSVTTVEQAYAKKAVKPATVKTETVPLRAGTYFGVVACPADALKTGLPRLASITMTVGAKDAESTAKDTISAKVALAGKSYTFKLASKEAPWDEESGTLKKKRLVLDQKIAGTTYSNVLDIEVADGSVATDWFRGICVAKLEMNVPTADGKSLLGKATYEGELPRQNAKVQPYLTAMAGFAGYYTLALVPKGAIPMVKGMPNCPAGNGYLTVTIDNKGKAKVAGQLADETKISLSVAACGLESDGKGGYVLCVPVYAAKSPYCFGGGLVLCRKAIAAAKPDGRMVNPDEKNYDIVVDAASSCLIWNNDNAALTYGGTSGWKLDVAPVGGWYDTVFNLQSYYKTYALSIQTAEIAEFPKEALSSGYQYVSTANNDPNGFAFDFAGNAIALPKKQLVKDPSTRQTDLENSVNPYNIQVKFARATGIVSGSFSLWTTNGTAQKEITGIKHNGVLVLQRDVDGALDERVLSAGFFNMKTKVSGRNWSMSCPFNLIGVDMSPVDWAADDNKW